MPESTIKSSVQRQFGNVAANYATSAVHANGDDLQTMVNLAHLNGEEWVLDAGCGAGHTALAFAPYVQRVIAYDLTAEMLKQVEQLATQRGVTNLSTRQGDVEELPFDAATFDIVVSRYSAHHWPDPKKALAEFVRVLKPGGQFILSDVVGYEEFAADSYLQTLEVLRDPSHVRDHRISEWERYMTAAGFQFEVSLNFDVVLQFRRWVTRMNTPELMVTALQQVFADASQDIRDTFKLEGNWQDDEDFSFVIPGAVLHGTL